MPNIWDEFAEAIDRQHEPKELAPVISHDEAYRAYANALGRDVATLTETEKQTAFLNHVLEKLARESELCPACAGRGDIEIVGGPSDAWGADVEPCFGCGGTGWTARLADVGMEVET